MAEDAQHPMAEYNRALDCANERDGFDHLLRAARAGCLRAELRVGLAYHTGRGTAADFEQAAGWYCKAAAGGDSFAIANLGVMCLLGQGAPGDDLDAYTWVRSAVELGHEKLRPALDYLEGRIGGDGGADGATREVVLAAISPEVPPVRLCRRAACDPSRCDAA